MKIFLNPGHAPNGDPDPGACNTDLDLRECDIALSIGEKVKMYLEHAGCTVELLQSDNLAGESEGENVTATANASGAFVSIHCNAFNGLARGIETLCYQVASDGGKLADCIQEELVADLRGIDTNIPDRGVKERPALIVLWATDMPAVLVETAFIDSVADAWLLVHYPDDIAKAIARGITDFFCKNS